MTYLKIKAIKPNYYLIKHRKHLFYSSFVLLIIVLFTKCNQNTPLRIVMYADENLNNSGIISMDREDSIALLNTFDSLKNISQPNEVAFYSFAIQKTPELLFSYFKNDIPIYLPKPVFDEIFLLQHAAMKDIDNLFLPVKGQKKITGSIANLFEQDYEKGNMCFHDVFNFDNKFLNDSLQLRNTTLVKRGNVINVIGTNSYDLRKLLAISFNGIVYGLNNLYEGYILKYRYDKIMPIGNWHIQNYYNIKLYWSSYTIAGNNAFFLLLPKLNQGIIYYETIDSTNSYVTNEEGDITYNPFIAQWMIFTLKNSKIANLTSNIIKDLNIKTIIGNARKLNESKKNKIINNKLKPFYTTKTPLASMNYVRNNFFGKRPFTLEKETKIRIKASGEGNKTISSDKDVDREHIEFVYDMNNDKNGPIDIKDFDRQFRISFSDSVIYGIFETEKNILCRYLFKDHNNYTLEAFFPWNTLGYIKPAEGAKFGFEISVSDNDGNGREKKISWYSLYDSTFYNTAYTGDIELQDEEKQNETSSLIKAGYSDQIPVIDGKKDKCWEKAVSHTIKNVVLGSLDNKNDIEGFFKIIWHSSGLFFLVHVTDDYVNYNTAIKTYYTDYGWIENSDNNAIVWNMTKMPQKSIGKEKINVFCDTAIILPAGNYNIVYTSDDSHAYMNWFDKNEYLPLYGIKVFYENK